MIFHQLRNMIEIDLPVRDENPEVNPPIIPVINTSHSGELFLSTIIDILPARMWSLLTLSIKLIKDHTKKEPRNADMKERILFCSIKTPGRNPAIANDHQGRKRPSEYTSNATQTIDIKKFFIDFYLNGLKVHFPFVSGFPFLTFFNKLDLVIFSF